MRKILIIGVLLTICTTLFGEVRVKDFDGKVKVKYPGEARWSRLNINDKLPDNATVSTGFNSYIVLDLGNATLDVMPLTRMTVNEITESQDTIATSLFLQGGTIKADVSKIEGKISDFHIKSPVATASVRGTSFIFSGNKLSVIRGVVDFGAQQFIIPDTEGAAPGAEDEVASKVVRVKAGGESLMASIQDRPVPPAVMARKNTTISVSTKPDVIKKIVKEGMDGLVSVSDIPSLSQIQQEIENYSLITISGQFEGQ